MIKKKINKIGLEKLTGLKNFSKYLQRGKGWRFEIEQFSASCHSLVYSLVKTNIGFYCTLLVVKNVFVNKHVWHWDKHIYYRDPVTGLAVL